MRNLILSLFLIISSITVVFGACDSQNEKPTTGIYFANGILNTYADALPKSMAVADAYGSSLLTMYPEQNYYFGLAFHHTLGSTKKDVLQIIALKLHEIGITDQMDVSFISRWMLYKKEYSHELTQFIDRDLYHQAMKNVILFLFFDILYDERKTIVEHLQLYKGELLKGGRVIVIPHSSANLFTNRVHDLIQRDFPEHAPSMSIMSIATMANRALDSWYLNANDDRAVGHAETLGFSVLPGNIDNVPYGYDPDFRDEDRHGFLESYFDPRLASRPKIDTRLYSLADVLPFPTPEIQSGALTVSLEWGTQPDLDLHIIEPNGSHVYYSNRGGVSGYLDRDVVSGYGPEHYYVKCEDLEVGTYKIGVVYYSGNTGETANVQISTSQGNVENNKHTFSTAGIYSSSWSDAVRLFDVVVGEDANQSKFFRIIKQ